MDIKQNINYGDNKITTALLLAAGIGSRLFPLTQNSPKCLTLMNGKSILERLVVCLEKEGFKRLVIVTGYKDICIKNFLGTMSGNMIIEYVHSPNYRTTNNIYSLWMARNIINEPFVLIESDLVFDMSQLAKMIFPDRIAIAPMASCMNGTNVSIDSNRCVDHFYYDSINHSNKNKYKTVNIYSFSLHTWYAIVEELDKYITAGKVNCYYETVFGEMVENGNLSLKSVLFNNKLWYEIDTLEDLKAAEKLFSTNIKQESLCENVYV